MKGKKSSYSFSAEELRKDLYREAKALRIHGGFAEAIIEKVVTSVEKYTKTHPVVTENDIKKLVYAELKKYHKDFAFFYHNRDKII